jgi:type IV pilus assembly protein PilC
MAVFAFEGIQTGKKVSGEIDGSNIKEASAKLQNQKIIILSIKLSSKKDSSLKDIPLTNAPITFFEGNIYLNFGPFGKVPTKELVQFTKKISTMIRAGLPILESITMIRDQTTHAKMRSIISQICKDLNAGSSLTEAFSKHPTVFNNIYINLIAAGEASGRLDDFLKKLVDLQEKNQKIVAGIKSALFYPVTLFTVATLITSFMLWKVVPVFEKMYGSMGVKLPASTAFIISASRFISSGPNVLALIAIFFGIRFGFKYLMKNVEPFRFAVHKFQLKIPLFGNLIQKAVISRMTMIMANLQAAGVGIVENLKIAESVTDNLVFVYAIRRISEKIVTGDSLSKLFADEKDIFPIELARLTEVGENSGNMEEMFQSISNYYEEEFDTVVKGLSTIIEPVMIVVIGAIIGILMVALYMPIFSVGKIIKPN